MACKPTPHSTCLTIHGFRKTDKCSRTTIGYIRATGLYTVGIAASWENRVGWEYGENAIEFGENLSDFATHCLGGHVSSYEKFGYFLTWEAFHRNIQEQMECLFKEVVHEISRQNPAPSR